MSSLKFNPYDVLGITKSCTEKDIQKAYKIECLKWHPDKNRDNQEEAQRKFIQAKEAFEFLYDKERRAEYDRGVEAVRVRDEKQRERMDKADERRRKFMEDLKERENQFTKNQLNPEEPTPSQLAAKRKREEKRVKTDFEELARRLQKEVDEEINAKNSQLQKEIHLHRNQESSKVSTASLRVKWIPSREREQTEAYIHEVFSKFGTISDVSPIIGTKKPGQQMCIVEFTDVNSFGRSHKSKYMDRFKIDWQRLPSPDINSKDDEDVIVIETPAQHNFHNMSFDDLLSAFDNRLGEHPPDKKTRSS